MRESDHRILYTPNPGPVYNFSLNCNAYIHTSIIWKINKIIPINRSFNIIFSFDDVYRRREIFYTYFTSVVNMKCMLFCKIDKILGSSLFTS